VPTRSWSWPARFSPGGARLSTQELRDFVDEHRQVYGVEPICKALQIAPSGYKCHAARQRNPALLPARVQRDQMLIPNVERVWQSNMQVYVADKVWKQPEREGVAVARCTVERLMRRQRLRGVMRGKVGAHRDQ